jgi:ATP-dependent DNA helicase RecQ
LSLNIPAARLDSTLSRDEYNAILERAKSGSLKILMISVERFKNERFRYHLEKMKISLMAIDEAHCISEWGHNFRPEYMKLPDYRKDFNIPQVLLLTATATTEVIQDMRDKFEILDKNVTITGFYRKNLYLQVSSVTESEKKNYLFNQVCQNPETPTIVYVTLQKTAYEVANFLLSKGIGAASYHAGMKNDERERVQDSFIRGELNCIVATIAFGMGIDKKDIRRIFHYDLPKTIENYSQEIGRSGRDGENSFCEVLANRDTINILENFVYGYTPEKHSVR